MTSRLSQSPEPYFDLDAAFSVVDVESTGQSTESHLIEIAVIRIERRRIVDSYQTLIRPPVGVPPFISAMTGLTHESLAEAPRFEEVADEVCQRLENSFLVAHNAEFDYGCLKTEFVRLGRHFYMERFCTVKLARKLFPGNRRYNLDAVCRRMEIHTENRHRAMGDAHAAAQIFLHVLAHPDAREWLTRFGKTFDHREKWAERLEMEIAKLPASRGVYIFRDAMGLPLYVGKSNNIRSRIFSHLRDDRLPKKKRLFKYTESFEAQVCETELEALLLESRLIRQLRPPYNVQQNHPDRSAFVRISREEYPKIYCVRERVDDDAEYRGPFRSFKLVATILERAQKRFLLCPDLMKARGKPKGFCFSYQLQRCCGACGRAMPGEVYRQRVLEAVEWMETALSLSTETAIDKFLKSRQFRSPELTTVRQALRDTQENMRRTPDMFAKCFLIVDTRDHIGYLVREGKLLRIFHGSELEEDVVHEAASQNVPLFQDAEQSRIIQNFINNNRQRIELHPIDVERTDT